MRPHCSTTYVAAAHCYRTSSVVSPSVTLVSPAKTAETIMIPFAMRTREEVKRTEVLYRVEIPHGKGQFLGIRAPIVRYRDLLP